MKIEICDVCSKKVERGTTFKVYDNYSSEIPRPFIDCCSEECNVEHLYQTGLARRKNIVPQQN